MTTDEIRQGLRNIKTRARTIDQVTAHGGDHIDAVLPLLQDRNEGVRWSAIQILAEIGDERAIGPLVVLLEQSKNASDATHALRQITGQELGDEPEAWREWVMQEPARRNASGAGTLSDDELVAAATRELPVRVSGGGSAYTVEVSLPEGRTHRVWIDFSRKDASDRPIVQLTTPCGDAVPGQYESALKMNMSISYGAIALASMEDRLCFAVVDSHLRQTVHPQDVAESIMSLAGHGDSIEASLTGEDRY